MTGFVEGVKTLFTGPKDNGADAAAAQQREQQRVDIARQQQTLQGQEGDQDRQLGRALRVPRGRKLLLASTGEQGLPSTLGG